MFSKNEIEKMNLDELKDAFTDVINERETYPEDSMEQAALELDELYLMIDARINKLSN